MVLLASLGAAAAAVARAALGRMAGQPGVAAPSPGSFDTWPAVPVAPGRQIPNGSRVPTA